MLADVASGWLVPGARVKTSTTAIRDSSKHGMCDTKLLSASKELGNS
jgi:hypothetical protein